MFKRPRVQPGAIPAKAIENRHNQSQVLRHTRSGQYLIGSNK
jgi:hypothetical protein